MSYYPFGERAAALIGVRVNSVGDLEVLARSRSDLTKPMTSLFSAGPIQAGPGGIEFTLKLESPYVGLLTVEVAGWVKAYEINRAHFLGYSSPFSNDELDYDPQRNTAFEANREFTCTYTPDGKLVLEDGLKSDREVIDIKSLDGTGYTGKVFVVIRVTQANYTNGCASLTFNQGVTVGGRSKFVLS